MKMKQLLFGLFLSLNIAANAQEATNKVLFTIDNKPYYTDEFIRVYNKNLDLVKDESQKDLNQYLDLFIGYKLKINKANVLGLQADPVYQAELQQYRNQLAKNYLTDSKVTKELVQEAYNRSKKEIKASHILFLVPENATPADTLKAYKKAIDIRQRALKGENFDELAQKYSEDPSAKENNGDLGYFSAFRMVYPFESAAFNTSKGQVSQPIRTSFGYHLIKVNDVRDNRGEVIVAHIMVMNPEVEDASQKEKVKNTIFDINKKLRQGENFETLARQFSEDKSSSSKGGVLNRFGSGQLSSPEFENVAFSLTAENPISEPFQSQFGWHIVKLIEKFPVKPMAEMELELENKIGRDDRSKLIAASMNEKLRKKYAIKRNDKTYAAIVKSVSPTIYEGTWTANDKIASENLFSIGNSTVTAGAFMSYIQNQQKSGLVIKPINKQVEALYQSFVTEQLNAYYDANLEREFPEFAAVMDEYRDGLLLFNLMEKEIWEKAKTDTIGLQKFYKDNSSKYQWTDRVDAIILSSTNHDIIDKANKLLKKNKSADEIRSTLNSTDVVNIMAKSGIYEHDSDVLPKGLKFKKGVSKIIKEGDYYFVAKINKLMPARAKTLDEAKGRVINDYQQYLEENWVKSLKSEFNIEVNKDVFSEVKSNMKQ